MNKLMTQSLVVAAAFAATPGIAGLSAEIKSDSRLVRLQQFLEEKDCPIQHLAPDFIQAADDHQLDWRLLPGISFVESSGGKYKKNNNIFGWNNGDRRFPTVRHGIYTVAARLSTSKQYRHKSTDRILATYNPRPEYRKRVREVMAEIGPEPDSLN